ncbi:MAG: carbohydrate ABC transporter permease [Mycoplasma sp.]|nr:carbohydrate ABC transporter permease [Mycoplasma sp.]
MDKNQNSTSLKTGFLSNYFKSLKLKKQNLKKKNYTNEIAGITLSDKIKDGIWRYSFMIFAFLIAIGPLTEIVITAFSNEQTENAPKLIFSLENFRALKEKFIDSESMPLYMYFVNSFIVSSLSAFWKVWLCMMAGFALYYYQTRVSTIVYALMLGTLTIPLESLIVGQFTFFYTLGLHNTLLALVMPYTVSVFTIFMFKNAFHSASRTVFSSAKIDGASPFKIFFKIAVPMVAPEIWKASIMAFISSWNSVIWPSTIILSTTDPSATLPLFLRRLAMLDRSDPDMRGINIAGLKMAGTLMVLGPMFIFYLITKNLIIKSITKDSGVKG